GHRNGGVTALVFAGGGRRGEAAWPDPVRRRARCARARPRPAALPEALAMRHVVPAIGGVAPQPPGPTPHRLALRPGGETLLARWITPGPPCLPHRPIARLRHDHATCLLARLRHDVPRGRQ